MGAGSSPADCIGPYNLGYKGIFCAQGNLRKVCQPAPALSGVAINIICREKDMDSEVGVMKTVLTVAGSDCSGGAGIQADIKTITAHRMYACSVVTALTAQNTTGVYGVEPVSYDFTYKQLECVLSDIKPDAVKIGMLADKNVVKAVADCFDKYGVDNLVIDTVVMSTSGRELLTEEARELMIKRLFTKALIITPNIPEAELLTGLHINSEKDMAEAAYKLAQMVRDTGAAGAVLVKGGHSVNNADDLLFYNGKYEWICSRRIDNPNTHGTGCTLSSAIACNLAAGLDLKESVVRAKEYITGAIAAGLDLGKGNGPLNHMYRL